ncbi:DNA repair protein RecO [bacterium SCSIO 12741]|nr:DNA repair protein RecO [bacterium SCSIO 12741]
MAATTDRGIFLWKTRYGDSGFVVRAYTLNHGMTTFLIQGLKGKKRSRAALLYPLAELEIEFSSTVKSEMKRIKEVHALHPGQSLRHDLSKSAQAFFIAEMLYRTLNEREADHALYTFLNTSIEWLDHHPDTSNFHLAFLVKLTRFLGFHPQGEPSARTFFDLREGLFTTLRPSHTDYVEPFVSVLLGVLLEKGFQTGKENLHREDRQHLLETLLLYYRIHLDGLGAIKSLDVLTEMFR